MGVLETRVISIVFKPLIKHFWRVVPISAAQAFWFGYSSVFVYLVNVDKISKLYLALCCVSHVALNQVYVLRLFPFEMQQKVRRLDVLVHEAPIMQTLQAHHKLDKKGFDFLKIKSLGADPDKIEKGTSILETQNKPKAIIVHFYEFFD